MGVNIRSTFSFWVLLSLSCSLLHCSAANDVKKLHSSATVVGTVICNTCFQQESSEFTHFITGASVAVECGDAITKPSFRKVVMTNKHGVFRVRLPPQVGKHVNTIKSCSVTLLKSSQPFCAVSSSATSSKLHLKSTRSRKINGVDHIFSAGFFTFKPLNQPQLCNQIQKPKGGDDLQKELLLAHPAFFFLPPAIPFLPSPSILPPLPNPLQPPPSVLPPLPIQPSPPPFFNLPPVPLLIPPPPPPPPFPFPPLPFPLIPRFPGIPPASP